MKFIHTADWQLGLKLRYLDPERAAQMRLLRFQTIEKIADLAKERQVDFVVVAGDVLDDNALGKDALQQTSDALRAFGEIPVFLLPGNHDAGTEDCALLRLDLPSNVHVLHKREPVSVAGGTLFPCPLSRRHESEDPTSWLPDRGDDDGIRIAVAHGGIINFDDSADSETPNLIDAQSVIAKGFDYLALGDWHGLLNMGPRIWYSGAHEATRFKEKKPGYALVVEIDSAGDEPKVEPVLVGQTYWNSIEVSFSDESQVAMLRDRLNATPSISKTLVQLSLDGTLSMGAREELDEFLEDYGQRVVFLRTNTDALHAQPTVDDLTRMSAEGFLAGALEELRQNVDSADEDALRLMYRLQRKATDASS